MLSISSLPLPNVVQYWVNICKDKYKLAAHCVANYGTLQISVHKICMGTIWIHQL